MSDIVIRPATTADLAAITEIYAEAVAVGTASFEVLPPDVQTVTVLEPAVSPLKVRLLPLI